MSEPFQCAIPILASVSSTRLGSSPSGIISLNSCSGGRLGTGGAVPFSLAVCSSRCFSRFTRPVCCRTHEFTVRKRGGVSSDASVYTVSRFRDCCSAVSVPAESRLGWYGFTVAAACGGMMMSPSPKPDERDDKSLRRSLPKVDGRVRFSCGAVDDMDGFGIKPPPSGLLSACAAGGTLTLDRVNEVCTIMGPDRDGADCCGLADLFSAKLSAYGSSRPTQPRSPNRLRKIGTFAAIRRANSLGLSRADCSGIVGAPSPNAKVFALRALLRRQKKKAIASSAKTPTAAIC